MKKKLIIAGIIAAVTAVCVVAGLALYRYADRISYSGSITADVRSRTLVERDQAGVPVITASNMEDMYFGLGYLHAQDRYAMIEYYRAVALGFSGGIPGNDGAALSRMSRAIGFARKANEIAGRIRDPYAGYLRAYARGVNEARRILDEKSLVKRDWAPEDIIAVLLLREWGNAFLNNRETIFAFPRDEAGAALGEMLPQDLITYYSESEADCVEVLRKIRVLVKKYIGTFDRGYAFFVPAQKTKDNLPVSAFTFDSVMSLYPGWYPVHIHAADRTIKGITHAGLPFIFAGNNQDIAFYGFTAAVDVQDFFAEMVIKVGKNYQYLGPMGWRDFVTVRGGNAGDAALHATENGPVLNDVFADREYGSSVVTVRSVYFNEGYIASLFDIPLSKSVEEAGALARNIVSLPRVYLFASDEAALRAWSGMVPVRKKSDSVFQAGTDAGWLGLVDLSVYRDAGQTAAGSTFLSDGPEPVRNNSLGEDGRYRRLNQLLNRKKLFTNQDVENVLTDKYSPAAGLFLPLFFDILEDNPMASARLTRIYFQNWKCRMKVDFVAPTVFHMLLQRFMYETYGDELKGGIDDVLQRWDLLVPQFYELVKENKSPLFDDKTTYATEYRDAIFDRAFLNTMRFLNRTKGPDMNDWNWGGLHRGRFSIPGAGKDLPDEAFGGSNDTLQLGSVGPGLAPLETTSLSGYFGIEESICYMYFAYSVNPRSAFYYGTVGSIGKSSFHEVYPRYTTTISPGKKK
jgi:penicillin G amidase